MTEGKKKDLSTYRSLFVYGLFIHRQSTKMQRRLPKFKYLSKTMEFFMQEYTKFKEFSRTVETLCRKCLDGDFDTGHICGTFPSHYGI